MPIRVSYEIRCSGRQAALLQTRNRFYAECELEKAQKAAQGGDVIYLATSIEREAPMTKPEEYLMLVYETRELQRRYFREGRRQEDLAASLEKESALDAWNRQTRRYVDARPGFQEMLKALPPESERARHFAFFQVVEEWRRVWRQYFAYKKRRDKEERMEAEMRKQCLDFEHAIDGYIRQALGL